MASAASGVSLGSTPKVSKAGKAVNAHAQAEKEKNMVFREPDAQSMASPWGHEEKVKKSSFEASVDEPVTKDGDTPEHAQGRAKAAKAKSISDTYSKAKTANPRVAQNVGRNANFLVEAFKPQNLVDNILSVFPAPLRANLSRNFGFFLKPFTILFSDPKEVRQSIPGLAGEQQRNDRVRAQRAAAKKKREARMASRGEGVSR